MMYQAWYNVMYLWNSMPMVVAKSKRVILITKIKVKLTDLYVIWMGIISGVCIPHRKFLSLIVQKVIVKVKVEDRQTET